MKYGKREEKMLRAVAKWLEKKGWKVLVISLDKIQRPVGQKLNYELVIHFTGEKRT